VPRTSHRSRDDANHNFVTHEFAAEIVRRVSVALGDNARVTPMKGALLARTYYEDVSQRPMSDVDVLVTDISLRKSLHELKRAGFVRVGVSSDLGVRTLSHPCAPELLLDLHRFPLPLGLGRVTNAWFLVDARADDSLFGAHVFIPTRTRLLAHTLGVIANDDVYRAHAHTLEDVNRLARAQNVDEDVRTISDAGLRIAAVLALKRVCEEKPSSAASALLTAIELTAAERRFAARLHAELVRLRYTPERALRGKIVSRFVADTYALRARSVLSAGLGKAQALLLNRWRNSP
jgi:hypothetical protein